MAQVCQTVLSLDASATQNLKEGINFSAGHCFIIYRHQDNFRACRNQCRHQGGLFITDIEDIDRRTVRCTKHNWKLNVATMKYINPPDSFMQDELEVERSADGGLKLLELDPSDPWTADPRPVQELQPGEVMLTYITHACMELKAGGKSMMFDPWLTGPAFARGWWLQHEPPEDAVERMCRADLIYISHMHSDHLSYPTLKLLSEKRPDVPIFVGNTSRPVFWYLDRSGVNLTNINIVPFGIWQNVDKDLRFMILMDGVHPEIDTCLIVEYKGKLSVGWWGSSNSYWRTKVAIPFVKTERLALSDDRSDVYWGHVCDLVCAVFVWIQNRVGVVRTVVLNGLLWDDLYIGFNNRISRDPDIYHHRFWTHFQSDLPLSAPDWNTFLRDRPTLHPAPSRVLLPPLFSQLWVVCLWWVEKVRHYFW
uniref:Cytidine monophosphate-N-acetylneuraminic acid hydroxylase n=1 Tax=Astyanax mexicanus TaxID=7994 RepID=A0A8B9HXM2_ASTMX